MIPSYFKDMKVVDERLSYLEDVVKELANCIQIVNANYQTLSDIVKELLEVHRNGKQEETNKGSKGQEVVQSEQQMEGLPKEEIRRPKRKRLHNLEAAD